MTAVASPFQLMQKSLGEAVVTMAAILSALATVLLFDLEPSAGVLVVVLTLSLARSQLDRDRRGRLESLVVLPVVALACIGVGTLLRVAPWAGAALFVLGLAASVWVRRFGPRATRAGSLVALPLVTILVTPPATTNLFSGAAAVVVPVAIALIALAWVTVFHWIGRRVGLLAQASVAPDARSHPRASRGRASDAPLRPSPHSPLPRQLPQSLRPSPTTRLAVQMGAGLAVSFVIGYVFFADHFAWVVLTAFIVASGNRGRGDVAYKSVLRLAGAAAGTLVAVLVGGHLGGQNPQTVALILAAVFVGTWLRPLGYAWWALFVTIALSLLQGLTGANPTLLLWPRLEEIVVGAVIAVAVAWFVLPVPSIMVLRRRLADALAALQQALDPETTDRSPDRFEADLDRLLQLLPAFRARSLLTRYRPTAERAEPADWIDALVACRAPAVDLIRAGSASGDVRRAVGAARRALKEPAELRPALDNLKLALTAS